MKSGNEFLNQYINSVLKIFVLGFEAKSKFDLCKFKLKEIQENTDCKMIIIIIHNNEIWQ